MFTAIMIAIAIIICFFIIVMYYDCSRFVTVRYELKSKKLARECTFVLLSDLHNKSFGEKNEKLLRKIEELAPDAILVAGDMLTFCQGE